MAFIKKVHDVAYFRNGVCGAGYYAVRFTETGGEHMVGILFDGLASCACAVHNVDLLADPKASLGLNAWRGDCFEPEIRQAIIDAGHTLAEPELIGEETER